MVRKHSLFQNEAAVRVLEIHALDNGQFRLYTQPGEINQGKVCTP